MRGCNAYILMKSRPHDMAFTPKRLIGLFSRKECSEDALKKSELRNKALIDAIPDAIILLNKEGVLLDYKAAHDVSTLAPAHQFPGGHLHDIMPDDIALQVLSHIDKALQSGETQRFDYKLPSPDNGFRHYEARLVRTAEDEVLAIVRDITEHRKQEEHLLHHQKMEALGTMTDRIAHEFNNIMTAIMGCGELLQDMTERDSPIRNYIDMIVASAQRAAGITKGMLAYTRKQAIHVEPLDINEILRTTEAFLRSLLSKSVQLKMLTSQDPLTVLADRGQLEQVLMNLSTNAMDAMPEEGTLTISSMKTEFEKEYVEQQTRIPPGAYSKISVTDTGVGIDKETQARIFDPFFTTKDVGKGTGLGLSIVYGIIRKHNGYASVSSELHKGTTFSIYLPLHIGEVTAKKAAVLPPPSRDGAKTILVAEDDVAIRRLLREILDNAGYRVIEAADGEDAINKFEACCERIDLLLFDIEMPKKKGTVAYKEIQRKSPDVKALFLTGYVYDASSVQDIVDDDNIFVTKPVRPKELLRKIQEVIG